MPNVNYIVDGELYHHGIKGQRWGDRNYQYEDGSLTPEGRRRYYGSAGLNRFRFGDAKSKPKTKEEKEIAKANSAYRVERHKAKMERKTQEALNKERIKKEQSNAKRAAEVAKLKSKVKPSSSSKKEDEENPKNDKKFDKHVKELLNNKKIKDYSKYTDEELEAAAKRKEAQNSLEAQKRAGTKIGRLEGYLKSPEGSKLLETTASSAINGVSHIAAEAAKSTISSYLNQNAKTMYERAVDKAGWERKQKAAIYKAESEARKAAGDALDAYNRANKTSEEANQIKAQTGKINAEKEKVNSEKAKINAETASVTNEEKREQERYDINKQRSQEAYEASKKVKEAQDKADIARSKATESEYKNRKANAVAQRKVDKIISQAKLSEADVKKMVADEEKEYRLFRQGYWKDVHTARKAADIASYNAKRARSESEASNSYASSRALNTLLSKVNDIDLTKNLNEEQLAFLMAIINSKK